MKLCPKHVTQYYRYGSFDDMTIYRPNDIEIKNDHAEIVLRNKDCQEIGRALIDLDDVERCSKYKWHIRKSGGKAQYVITSLPDNKKIHLHRFVIGYDGEDDVDHVNRNGLDNRKSNLRVVVHRVNARNNGKAGVKRVPSGRYQASCCRNYKTIYIGTYNTYDEAVLARKQFVEEYDKTVGQ